MTLPPQLATAKEKCQLDSHDLTPLLDLWVRGFVLTPDDARELAAALPLNLGRKTRDALMTARILEHKAAFRVAYMRARPKQSKAWDQQAFDAVYPKFRTLPNGKPFPATTAERVARGGGHDNINDLVRQMIGE